MQQSWHMTFSYQIENYYLFSLILTNYCYFHYVKIYILIKLFLQI